jgi:hypothetical protein
MKRTYMGCDDGRIVLYTSADGQYSAASRPTRRGWMVLVTIGAGDMANDPMYGPFRSEKEAMDQARSKVKYYELEHPNG